jgi:hypothetical protein
MRAILLTTTMIALAAPAVAQDRARSPYLACGADFADQNARKKRKSAEELAFNASRLCEPALDQNVAFSLEKLQADAAASGRPLSEADLPQARVMLRQKLREGLTQIVQNRVTYRRAEAAAAKAAKKAAKNN